MTVNFRSLEGLTVLPWERMQVVKLDFYFFRFIVNV